MEEFGRVVPLYMVAPFALMLASIAVLPLLFHQFWERDSNKALVAGVLGLPTAAYLLSVYPSGLLHSLEEYASFLMLLGSLYAIAGGIHVSGDLKATPRTNLSILALGAVLANLIGTTGASMVLIRVLLRTNHERKHTAHLPFFFILIVSNCGGLLTPLGDPPLFLGYLRGVPFSWTFGLLPYWVIANAYLLSVLFFVDHRAYAKESAEDVRHDAATVEPLKVTGLPNVLLLAGVVGCIFLPTPVRELGMLALSLVSLFAMPKGPRELNRFSYGPIIEVAILFLGIFVTMVPALALLEARGSELGLSEPAQFFFVTGALSSMLDNAPTYLTFLSTLQGMPLVDEVVGVPEVFLAAISVGAVFMGANTYIGNGPNFMVKAIAEESGYKMPSFVGYAGKATLTLAPIYVVVMLLLQSGR